ncbi:MAG TPA: M17 family peptidase N-terminal domain-containing protein, partial [Candidatus Acidoferrales bacterium]|nr:M17 family peptidase N-terminal domain-containing protein [Candidatus Acidoferrales bacterium]
MELIIESQPFAKIAAEALVTYVYDKDEKIEGVLAEVDAATGGRVRELAASGELTGKLLEMTLLHNPPGLAARRLLLVGLGKPEKWTNREILRASGAALRFLKTRAVRRMAVLAREQVRDAAAAQAVVEGLLLGDMESD